MFLKKLNSHSECHWFFHEIQQSLRSLKELEPATLSFLYFFKHLKPRWLLRIKQLPNTGTNQCWLGSIREPPIPILTLNCFW